MRKPWTRWLRVLSCCHTELAQGDDILKLPLPRRSSILATTVVWYSPKKQFSLMFVAAVQRGSRAAISRWLKTQHSWRNYTMAYILSGRFTNSSRRWQLEAITAIQCKLTELGIWLGFKSCIKYLTCFANRPDLIGRIPAGLDFILEISSFGFRKGQKSNL